MPANSPVTLAAIDAGSNAIRLAIVRADPDGRIQRLVGERFPLRLGRHVFLQRSLEEETMIKAVEAFQHFRRLMEQHGVTRYRAVATSAVREAENRGQLTDWIRRQSGIVLEVIDGAEEARLVRKAVLGALGQSVEPRWIVDLGGGSLEINLMKGLEPELSVTLPLGTVRLMEEYRIEGALDEKSSSAIIQRVATVVTAALSGAVVPQGSMAVACGGNAEALALVAPGEGPRGLNMLDLVRLEGCLEKINSLDVSSRMKSFDVRRDRAEVMGLAALVLVAMGRVLGVEQLIVPGVGVREGVLQDLTDGWFATVGEPSAMHAIALVAARELAGRFGADTRHAEQVRRLALDLFDALQSLHGLGPDSRGLLELAAVLHDIGAGIHRRGHHKHGEYLVAQTPIEGLSDAARLTVAAIVRYHSKSDPDSDHRNYSSLPPPIQQQVRVLSALLRVADGLDADHEQTVKGVQVSIAGRKVTLTLDSGGRPSLGIWGVGKRKGLLEKELAVRMTLERK